MDRQHSVSLYFREGVTLAMKSKPRGTFKLDSTYNVVPVHSFESIVRRNRERVFHKAIPVIVSQTTFGIDAAAQLLPN